MFVLNEVIKWIAGILFVLLVVGKLYYGKVVSTLTDSNERLTAKVLLMELNTGTLRSAVKTQNKATKVNADKLAKATLELQEWKSKPPVVKYKIIYKDLPVKVREQEVNCESTENIINAMRDINFNSID